MLFKVRNHGRGVKFSDEDFGETWFGSSARSPITPAPRIVHGKRSLIEITLELKAGLVDKLLVLRIARHRRQLRRGVEGSNPLQVDVEKTVGSRQQAGSFGRRVLAKRNHQRDRAYHQQKNDQDG